MCGEKYEPLTEYVTKWNAKFELSTLVRAVYELNHPNTSEIDGSGGQKEDIEKNAQSNFFEDFLRKIKESLIKACCLLDKKLDRALRFLGLKDEAWSWRWILSLYVLVWFGMGACLGFLFDYYHVPSQGNMLAICFVNTLISFAVLLISNRIIRDKIYDRQVLPNSEIIVECRELGYWNAIYDECLKYGDSLQEGDFLSLIISSIKSKHIIESKDSFILKIEKLRDDLKASKKREDEKDCEIAELKTRLEGMRSDERTSARQVALFAMKSMLIWFIRERVKEKAEEGNSLISKDIAHQGQIVDVITKRVEDIEEAYKVKYGKILNLKCKKTTMDNIFRYANQFCGLNPNKDSEIYATTRENGRSVKDSGCVRLTSEMFEIDPTVADRQDWKPVIFESEKNNIKHETDGKEELI